MRSLPVFAALLALSTCALGSGWVGECRVSADFGQQPCIALDSFGRMWAMWHASNADTTLVYSQWLESEGHWSPERGVGPNGLNVYTRLNPALAFGEGGRACLVWGNKYENSDDSIGSCFWADTGWTPEVLVNQPDSFDLHFMPKVAYGGGQFWCVWYAGKSSTLLYSVFASRWNDAAGRWEPQMQVSPPDGTHHWWCDVAVDGQGMPHVVWCNSERGLICYSSYNSGTGWAVPLAVNDTTLVGATGWADPRIVVDHTGMMHVCYTGVAQGATGRDIFYTRNDGSGWTPSERVTQDTLTNYNEWYSDLDADRPDNVWIVWDRQNEGSDQFRIHASHYDGSTWSAEVRLDGDSARHDNGSAVCIDAAGNPCAVWAGNTHGIQLNNIYFNRYVGSGVAESAVGGFQQSPLVSVSPNPFSRSVTIECGVRLAPGAGICIFSQDGRQVRRLAPGLTLPGSPTTSAWDGTDELDRCVPRGVYLAVVEGQVGVRAKLVKLD